jgi:hypothetical protein
MMFVKHAIDPQCLMTKPRFTHDAWSVFATVILGFTNGYIGTLSLLFIIDMVEPHETAYAGTLASFFLNTGMCSWPLLLESFMRLDTSWGFCICHWPLHLNGVLLKKGMSGARLYLVRWWPQCFVF